jgi:hypothetical protein
MVGDDVVPAERTSCSTATGSLQPGGPDRRTGKLQRQRSVSRPHLSPILPGMERSREGFGARVPTAPRGAFAVLLCAAFAAGCSQSTSNPGFTGGSGDQGDDADVTSDAAADGGTSSEGASGDLDATAASGGTDAGSPTKPRGAPDSGAGKKPTPDAGTGAPTGADGGACTVHLDCTLTAPASTGDIRQDCVNRINQFRTTCACLKPLARWTAGEACADMDAQYDAMKDVGHAGAMANICNWGEAQDECPGDPSNQYVVGMCLQQMWSEGPPPAGTTIAQCESPQMIDTCYEAHGHFINMSNPDVTQVACGFYTTSSGAVWAAQNFSP